MGQVNEPDPVGAIIDMLVTLAMMVLVGLAVWISAILTKVRDLADR